MNNKNIFPKSYISFAILVGLVVCVIYIVGSGVQDRFDLTLHREMNLLVYIAYYLLILVVVNWANKNVKKIYSISIGSRQWYVFEGIVIGLFILIFCAKQAFHFYG